MNRQHPAAATLRSTARGARWSASNGTHRLGCCTALDSIGTLQVASAAAACCHACRRQVVQQLQPRHRMPHSGHPCCWHGFRRRGSRWGW